MLQPISQAYTLHIISLLLTQMTAAPLENSSFFSIAKTITNYFLSTKLYLSFCLLNPLLGVFSWISCLPFGTVFQKKTVSLSLKPQLLTFFKLLPSLQSVVVSRR